MAPEASQRVPLSVIKWKSDLERFSQMGQSKQIKRRSREAGEGVEG
jgi:hypothetical protein